MSYERKKSELTLFKENIYHLAPIPIVYKVFDEHDKLHSDIITLTRRHYKENILEVPDERHRDKLGKPVNFTDVAWKENQIPAIGIWHSVPTNGVLNIEADSIKYLKGLIEYEYSKVIKETEGITQINPYISESWIQFYKRGDQKVLHNHERYGPPYPKNRWAGAYYLDDGGPDKSMPYSGVFSFRIRQSNHYFKPSKGMLLMFPADILHEVHPFYGARERIVINFNINNK